MSKGSEDRCGKWVVWDNRYRKRVGNTLVGKKFARVRRDEIASSVKEPTPVKGRSRGAGDNGDKEWRFVLRRAG